MLAQALGGCVAGLAPSAVATDVPTAPVVAATIHSAELVTTKAMPEGLSVAPSQTKLQEPLAHDSVSVKLAHPPALSARSSASPLGLAPVAAVPSCPPAGTRVLLIGDSLSHGLGPQMARVARECGTPFFHHGVVGSHVTQWAQDHWLNPQLQRAQPTVVMVSLGGNDYQRTDPHNVRVAIPKFLDKVNAAGAELLWIGPPTFPFQDKIGVRDMWFQSLEGRNDTAWYPTDKLTIPRGADRIHPTMQGNRDLSRTLWQWMSSTVVSAA